MNREHREARDPTSLANMVTMFARASGLRRKELQNLRVGDVYWDDQVIIVIHEEGTNGRESRIVKILMDHEDEALFRVRNKNRHDLVFPVVPPELDLDASRRWYAQQFFEELLLRFNQETALSWMTQVLAEPRNEIIERYGL